MITARQKKVYLWIRGFVRENGMAPTYGEIREGLGLKSLNTVSYHLRRLEDAGLIRSPWGNKKRAIELRDSPWALPLLGEVRAGEPVESYETAEEVELPSGFLGASGDHFALRVRGESMADEGIRDGDLIVVRRAAQAENGQTVVALVDGEATVKRYRRRGADIELIPANPEFRPIVASEGRVRVLGAVVALFRKY